jgi:DNA polymerase-3 subunit beta
MLTGVRMEFEAEKITLAATDRFRLAVRELPWLPSVQEAGGSVLVRAKTLADLARPMAGVESVDIALDAGRSLIGITGARRRSTTPLLDGEFPDYRRLLPSESATVAVVSTSELTEAVKRVKLVVDRSSVPIQLEFADGEVRLLAGAGEDARAEEILECDHTGDAIKIAFNPDYLLEGLAALHGPAARLAMTLANKPVVVTNEEGSSAFRYLLMPVRMAN